MFHQSQIVFEDEGLKVPNDVNLKKYKVPEEALEKLKKKFSYEKLLIEDLDQIDILVDKEINNSRAKMQLISLLRKYGMKEVADKRFPLESEIYDGINNIIIKQHQLMEIKRTQDKPNEVNCEDDKLQIIKLTEKNVLETMEKTMNKISQLEGNTDYAYQLLDRALDEDKTR